MRERHSSEDEYPLCDALQMREGKSQVYKAYRNSSQQSSYNLMRPQAQTQLQFKAHP